MKSNIQRIKEFYKAQAKENGYTIFSSSDVYSYLAFVMKDKDEDGENYFSIIDGFTEEEEVKAILNTPTANILRVEEWIAGENGGREYTTDVNGFAVCTRDTYIK